MNYKRIIPYIVSFALLSGCSGEVGTASIPKSDEYPTKARDEATEPVTEQASEESATADAQVSSDPPSDVLITTADKVEVYDNITLASLIKSSNVTLENGDEIVDTSELGERKITVRYTYGGMLYEQELSYTVADTTAPLLLNSGSGAMIEKGKTFRLTDFVGYADNYDRKPTLTYEGEVDTNTIGSYPIKATVTDSSGNSTSWDLKIMVLNELIVPPDNNKRVPFSSFMEKYSGSDMEYGIDVSKWQGNIDFEAVKNAGCSFVIMRIGHYYDEHEMDKYYLDNMAKARAAGLKVGVYLYTTANTEEKIKANAKWIADKLDGQTLDFPIVFDWESFSNFQQYEMSIRDLNDYFELFADEMESYGYSAMLYSSKNFLNNFWYDHSKEHPIWLAHYCDETDYTGEYSMWQASCYGKIDGIAGDVDMNILYTKKPMNP